MREDVLEATAYIKGLVPIDLLDWGEVKTVVTQRWPKVLLRTAWPRRQSGLRLELWAETELVEDGGNDRP